MDRWKILEKQYEDMGELIIRDHLAYAKDLKAGVKAHFSDFKKTIKQRKQQEWKN